MANDKLIFKPTDRNSITKIEPNNYAVEILDDRVFDITSISNLILDAIESIDSTSITAGVNIDLVLSALEAVDTSGIITENLINAYITESENIDILVADVKVILTAALSGIEQTDIPNIKAFSGVDRNAELSVVENSDSANIRINHTQSEKSRTYVPLSRVAHLNLDYSRNAKLKVKENSDSCNIQIISDHDSIIHVSENRDGIRIKSENEDFVLVAISENRDGTVINESEFFEDVRKLNERYEQSELELFALVA